MPALNDEQREYEQYRSLKIAINFCEHAYESDGFWTLFRCFRGVEFRSYPAIMRPMDVHVVVADAAGVKPRSITLTLIDPERGQDSVMWTYTDRLFAQKYRWVSTSLFHVPALALIRPDRYDLHVEIDGHLLELASLDAIVLR